MTDKAEKIIKELRENPPKDVDPEEIVLHLFQQEEIQLSDYLKLQEEIEKSKKPVLDIKLDPEQMVFDTMEWLEYSKYGKIILKSND